MSLVLYLVKCEYGKCPNPIIKVNDPNLAVWHNECYYKFLQEAIYMEYNKK